MTTLSLYKSAGLWDKRVPMPFFERLKPRDPLIHT